MVGTRYTFELSYYQSFQPDLHQVLTTFVDSRTILFPFTREGSYIFGPSKHFIEDCFFVTRFTLPLHKCFKVLCYLEHIDLEPIRTVPHAYTLYL